MDFDYRGELGSQTEVDLLAVESDLEVLAIELDGPSQVRTRKVRGDLVTETRSPGRSREFNEVRAVMDGETAEIYTAGDSYNLSPAATDLMEYLENVYTETIDDPGLKNWRGSTL